MFAIYVIANNEERGYSSTNWAEIIKVSDFYSRIQIAKKLFVC